MCEGFFESVSKIYPHLVESNIKSLGNATADLLETGSTEDMTISSPQYPRLPLCPLSDPVFNALYEVGSIKLHSSGDPIVEPSPVALVRGLARIGLPGKFLYGIVNAARERQGRPKLSKTDFYSLDKDLFQALRNGLNKTIGENWFRVLNQGADILHKLMVLPCTRLPGSQEFYEEGINFYRNQGTDAEVYIYSTTSGLVIPREFSGDASKNHYRYNYFTKGVLGQTSCHRVYQWERYRTAKGLAEGYEEKENEKAKSEYLNEAYRTFDRFAKSQNISIYEVDRFPTWKSWHTLVGPVRQQLSIRDETKKLTIGHGVSYDGLTFSKRADLLRDVATLVGAMAFYGGFFDFLREYGPALAVVAINCALAGVGTKGLQKLIRDPIMRKCKNDRDSKAREIKARGKTLSRRQVEQVVDRLLFDGKVILSVEKPG